MKRKLCGFCALILAAVFVLSMFTGCEKKPAATTEQPTANPTEEPVEEYKPIMQRFEGADTIYVIRASTKGISGKTMKADEKMLLQSLQGVVAQRKAEIYIGSASDKFLKYAKKKYGITLDDGRYIYYVDENGEEVKTESNTEWLANLGTIINHYVETGDIQGYVKLRFDSSRYNEQDNQVNQACTLAGINKWIMVSEEIEATINEYCPGVKLGRDISNTDLTQKDIFLENVDLLNKDMLIMQAAKRYENLREYGIASKAGFFFYNEGDPIADRKEVYSKLNMLANVFGWAQIDEMEDGVKVGAVEDPSVDFAARYDASVIAADWCSNLSVWSSMPITDNKQVESIKYATEDENVHYVTMLFSDGDNLQWTSGTAFTDQYFLATKADKKEMPFGWTLTANLAETAPAQLSYIYENMVGLEHFVCSVSGYTYAHPQYFSDEAIQQYAKNTAQLMEKADMKYLAVKGIKDNAKDAFAQQEAIEGGFVMYGRDGSIYWSNDKPFVNDRIIFWKDTGDDGDPAKVAKNITKISNFSTDKTSTGCYTFIQVHCWSYKYRELQKSFYNEIDKEKIKVVTPDEFIQLIKKNVKHTDKEYTTTGG